MREAKYGGGRGRGGGKGGVREEVGASGERGWVVGGGGWIYYQLTHAQQHRNNKKNEICGNGRMLQSGLDFRGRA